jgi:UDP-galactopyranose mutase
LQSRREAADSGASRVGCAANFRVDQATDEPPLSTQGANKYDVLIVGAGFAGAVMAERFASSCDARVLVVDRRPHIAGNAYDVPDEDGVLVHRYGPHIFHTSSRRVVDYLSRFTAWRPYEHRVVAAVNGQLLPVPINRQTINRLYGLDLACGTEVDGFYAARAEQVDAVRTSEDAIVSRVGRELYETFFRGYTRKQWGRDPRELHASVCGRIPSRLDDEDRYFDDWHQAMPANGYTAMFERILGHPNIELAVGTELTDVRDEVEFGHLVYTGPIDAYFDHRLGALPYRSLEWELRRNATPDGGLLQSVATINFPSEDVPYTRVTEFRHLSGQSPFSHSTLAIEYPRRSGEPYYPIPSDGSRALYKRYRELARRLPEVTFVGRLARYQYLNMDQVVGQALASFDGLIERGVARPVVRAAAG